MSEIMNGKAVSERIYHEIKQELKYEMIKPSLAVIQIGNDKASELYIKNKKKACDDTGIFFRYHHFDDNTPELTIINKIKEQDKAAAEKLELKKQEVNELAQRLYKLENTNMELLKHGMHITNKTLEIIIKGLKPITNEYNQRGQNITKDQLEMSSIVEEG